METLADAFDFTAALHDRGVTFASLGVGVRDFPRELPGDGGHVFRRA